MSDSALRSACHPPLLSFSLLSLCLSECLSVFFCLLLPLHLLFLFSLFFPELHSIGENWRCDFLEKMGIIGSISSFSYSFPDICCSLPFCVALNEGKCQEAVCSEIQERFLRYNIRKKMEYIKMAMKSCFRNDEMLKQNETILLSKK